ncbi:hypothetical protein EG328_011498 [Venturia inaequalis]|uniref:Uncharacterized protein n=1 Tax=Venturia inaequalis TaxID=5025 RepID=A0A8H3YJZ8_VENIN|nr:hypothetical protein EG328_011498 [Venturia inaequalis]KAE9969875.1 hypothetical protein EG327_010444 [Venturia inaequalis]
MEMSKDPFRPITGLPKLLKTLYLFGKSDIPAATLPTMAIALVLTGSSNPILLAKAFVWNQLHLLTFQVKNQIDGVEEDRIAKPYRPLPAGRITLEDAQALYYCLFGLMLLSGISLNTLPCTIIYSVAIVVYNEGGLAVVPVLKNIIGAIGLACYAWGTTTILDHGRQPQGFKSLAALMICAIFATTGHAQDFRDRSADTLMGRKTIPLLLPQGAARWSLAALILAWTVGLIVLWQPPIIASAVFFLLGMRCLGGYLLSYEEKDDYVSYCWYGFWLLASNLLPIFPRLRGDF